MAFNRGTVMELRPVLNLAIHTTTTATTPAINNVNGVPNKPRANPATRRNRLIGLDEPNFAGLLALWIVVDNKAVAAHKIGKTPVLKYAAKRSDPIKTKALIALSDNFNGHGARFPI